MAASLPEGVPETEDGKRPQFGSRFLSDPARVFHHNAWDNVKWSEEQAAAAERKVQENSSELVCPEKQVDYEVNAHKYWDDFYKIHENGFFKDRHWLFTEFPELAPSHDHLTDLPSGKQRSEVCQDGPGWTAGQHKCSCTCRGCETRVPPVEEPVTQRLSHLQIRADEFPGSSATYRILEVGCGVGNTVFPILQTNNNPNLFVYCCDFSATAIELLKANSEYDPSRCFAFVHDLCDEDESYPVPEDSLDVIVLIFVLSAIVPDKMQKAISKLSRLLKPGGVMLLRDYGRYDMAQLRFKKGQCLSGNFYVRGDGTRVYFFTQDELDALFTAAGLEKVQSLVDRRLQVNRGKQLTMYRVWIQCKYRKPLEHSASRHVPIPCTT
ncbi:tRNA N(3)-cytidine methyltransferase METTL2A [Arvicanthis niloticus]|uniref:tRNA N(3)-cytidine methyltransferase METTL2A n=1 Tax=Arvicanthis niloticus TaxID=61156 RepID=UPI001487574E|nr:tRNA N(3)-methylcytidine methyltransferase METTL2A [Arvicanthis niloticus]